jgi:hypothetical protein
VSQPVFPDYTSHVILQQKRLNMGGYDKFGLYYGVGERLYYIAAISADGMEYIYEDEFRAKDRTEAIEIAKEIFPNGRFIGAKK